MICLVVLLVLSLISTGVRADEPLQALQPIGRLPDAISENCCYQSTLPYPQQPGLRPDGRHLLTANTNGRVYVLRLRTK